MRRRLYWLLLRLGRCPHCWRSFVEVAPKLWLCPDQARTWRPMTAEEEAEMFRRHGLKPEDFGEGGALPQMGGRE